LFDGEAGLRSQKAQSEIAKKYLIKVHAEPFFKRNMAERAIREIKLRLSIVLKLEGQLCTFCEKTLVP
jgi:hypothetical protein